MKKAVTYWFIMLFLLLAASIFLVSCGTKKLINQKKEYHFSENEFEKIYVKNELIKSLAINDTLKLKVPKLKTNSDNCDSVCNIEFQKWLLLLNQEKKSGNNAWKLYYNLKDSILNLNVSIDQTQNYKHDSIYNNEKSEIKTTSIEKEIPIKYTPIIYKILSGIGIFFIIMYIIKIFKL